MPRNEAIEPRARVISIPLKGGNGNEVIEISTDDMPSGDDVIEILQREQAPLKIWIEVGLEYYRQSVMDAFMKILEMSGHEAGLNYPDVEDDQMRALDMLAAYYVHKGHKERTSREKRTELFNKATILFTTADRIKMYDTSHLTGRAWFCLLEGKNSKLDQADQQFNFVMKQNANDIPAMLGKACIAFNTKDYKHALYFYKKALQQKPDGPADFRVGLGYCYARMGNLEKARQAFERALEINEQNVPALVSLAILDQNSGNSEESLSNSISRLSLAYKLEPENPVVLIHLANHFFFKGDLSKVEQLAWHALQIADNSSIKGEACYQLARCFHSEKNYEKAFRYYYQATTLDPNFILAHFGLGQLHIYKGELNQAISSFETVIQHYPNNVETLKILGSLYAHSDIKNQERRQKAREAFQKLLKFCPDDIEGLIDLAQLLENTDPTRSLELYEKSIQLLRDVENVDPQPEMVNNIGALHMQLGNYERAKDFFEEAQRILETSLTRGDTSADSNMMVTIRYNLARCLEYLCLYNDAETVYKSILVQHQNYVDCYMRLGCICRDRGQIYDSSIWFKQAIPYDEVSHDAWTLIGNLHMSKNEWGPAQKKFEMIVAKGGNSKMNAYAHIALGNVWLEQLFNPARKREDDPKNMDRALQMFVKAIKLQPKNIWAANGIGCILAVKRQWEEARETFSMVRELTAEFSDVWFNIAHVYMEMGQYVPAIQMYTNAMKKFKRENDVLCLMYLARAYCRAGKMPECRETLEKARHFEAA
ncbi:hypothetical protein WR25_20236 [Diploscapter pachys]|uniref:Uncharacterized protein n=1 Tax=Diploscapter pachys TaxID=2018661 RepID=A0A2A2KLB7_9BILA|nr:hypothetical protein WR25_20236 [Diploscapter pachys]